MKLLASRVWSMVYKIASSTVYAIKPELFYTGHLWFLILIAAAFLFFLILTRKEGKPGSRGGSARVPVAEASPCAPEKGRAVAAERPPGGERSVCGMSGRPIAAAPYVFAEFIRIPHTDHVRTPHDGFSCEHQADRTKSRHRRRCPLSRSRRSAREGTWGRRNAPRSHCAGISIFRRRFFANLSPSVAQIVEERFFASRHGRHLCNFNLPRVYYARTKLCPGRADSRPFDNKLFRVFRVFRG